MKAPKMKKVPSALKWLAEKRARVSHELNQTELVVADVERRRDGLRLDLAALDRALALYDPAIDPTKISPINGWQGKVGKRGVLRQTGIEVLQSRAPEWVSTSNLATLVTLELGLFFELPKLRENWYGGSFRGTLKKLVADGLAENEQDSGGLQNGVASWRWKQEVVPTLAELRGQTATG